jgi:hypothetical protein
MNRFLGFPALVILALPATAAEFESGPAAGAAIPQLKVFDTTGAHAGREVDYAADRQAKPTIYVFITSEKWDRPVARFLRKLDEEVGKRDGLHAVAVWLTDEPETTKEYLPRAQQSLQLKGTTFTCYPVAKKSPEHWNINFEAGATVVVAKNAKVVRSLAFRTATERDVKAVVEAMGTTIGGTEKR